MYFLLPTFLILFFGIHVNALSYPTTKLQGMVGFAESGGVTGGWSGTVVEINTLADLQKYIGDSTPRVLVINSNIKASTKTTVKFGSNKSIIGSFNKPTLHNIYLYDDASSGNIIFQNLIFQHDASIKGNSDDQLYISHSSKYWIDHCSFVGHAWSSNDVIADKLLKVGETANYVTISNCYFANHLYGVILGYPGDIKVSTSVYNLRLTMCNNYFENVENRGPGLFRYGQYHLFNNYIRNYSMAIIVATEGKIISENNYFESNLKSYKALADTGIGQFTDSGSVPTITGQKSPKSDWAVKSYYSYSLKTALEAKSFALASAGVQSSNLKFSN